MLALSGVLQPLLGSKLERHAGSCAKQVGKASKLAFRVSARFGSGKKYSSMTFSNMRTSMMLVCVIHASVEVKIKQVQEALNNKNQKHVRDKVKMNFSLVCAQGQRWTGTEEYKET